MHRPRTSALDIRSGRLLVSLVQLTAFLSGFQAAEPSQATELSTPLTTAQVECQEQQLAHFLERMTIKGAGPFGGQEDGIPWSILLSPGRAAGSFVGLGLSNAAVNNPDLLNPQPVPKERQLAFHLDLQDEQLFLDPRRPILPQATFVREEPATTLVSANDAFRLTLSLDTGASGTQGPLASINNFAAPATGVRYNGFLASSTQPGRGLLAVGATCGTALSGQDDHVLAILRRMFRVTIEDLDDGCETCAFHSSHEISLSRGEGAHDYLFNVYPYRHNGTKLGWISGRIVVGWDPNGKLTDGTFEVFSRCVGGQNRGCSATPVDAFLFVWPPGTAGVSPSPPQNLGFASIHYVSAIGSAAPVDVSFATLLAQSSWN